MLKDFQLTSLEEKGEVLPRFFVINTQHIVGFEFVYDSEDEDVSKDAIITLVTGEKFYCPDYEKYIAYNRKKDDGTWEYVDKEI